MNGQSMPDKEKVSMYFIAVILPPALNELILAFKNYMLEKYNCNVGLKSPAHITLIAPFWMREEQEPQLITDIEIVSEPARCFRMESNDFSAFQPRTIFIDVKNGPELNALKSTTDAFFKEKDYKIKIDQRPFHPHITIATRDLHKISFYEAWDYFKVKSFRKVWIADNISLLKHNKKNWDVIHTSQFQNS